MVYITELHVVVVVEVQLAKSKYMYMHINKSIYSIDCVLNNYHKKSIQRAIHV